MPHRAMQQQLRQRRERWKDSGNRTGEPGSTVGRCISLTQIAHGAGQRFPHISAAETGRSARMPGSCFHSVLAAELNTAAGKTKPHQPAREPWQASWGQPMVPNRATMLNQSAAQPPA